jgi:hypothetical protein
MMMARWWYGDVGAASSIAETRTRRGVEGRLLTTIGK